MLRFLKPKIMIIAFALVALNLSAISAEAAKAADLARVEKGHPGGGGDRPRPWPSNPIPQPPVPPPGIPR